MTSSQPQFEYDRAPDMTALMKQRQAEELAGMEAAERAARRNDEMRIENAKQFDRMITGIGKFSKAAGEALEKHRDARDLKLRNQAQSIKASTGATWGDMVAHNKAWEDGSKEAGYWNSLAVKAREQDNETLAHELENMSGHKERILKQLLLKNAAINYKDNLNKAKETYVATLEDGTTLSYGQIKTGDDWDEWLLNYNNDQGFNDTSWAKAEFLDQNFYPTYNKAVTQAKSEWSQGEATNLKTEREQGYSTQLELAAKTGTLGETVYNLLQSEGAYYQKDGAAGVRIHMRDQLVRLLETGEIDPAQFDSLYDYKFKRHDGKEVDLSNWQEFDRDKINEVILNAQIKDLNNLKKEEQIASTRYVFDLKNQIRQEGRRVTEDEAKKIEANFKDAFPDQVVPQYIKTLNTRTQEDRNDDDIVADMEAKLARGEAIGDQWQQISGDDELRAKWQKIASDPAGQGLDVTYTARAHKDIKAVLKTELDETSALATDSEEYLLMNRNAQNYYADQYRAAPHDNPQERHLWALEQTLNTIKTDPNQFNTRGTVTVEQLNLDKQIKAEADLIANAENGIDVTTTRIINGTEEDYKLLVNYANDPVNNRMPPIYRQLARNPAFQKRGITAWDIANNQYKSQTGKELPMPNSQNVFRGKSPIVQYLLSRYPTYQTVRQAVVHDKMDGDFSNPETLNEELVTQ